jgi:hypothetical protein
MNTVYCTDYYVLVRGKYFLYQASDGMWARSSGSCLRLAWPGPRMMVVRNSVLAHVVLMLSGLDDAACYHI